MARGEDVDDDDMEEEDLDEEDDGANGLAALLESAQSAAKEYNGEGDNEDNDMIDSDEDVEYELSEVEDDEEDQTGLDKSRKSYDKIFKSVVEASDVVLYVLDARDPESTRSKRLNKQYCKTLVRDLFYF